MTLKVHKFELGEKRCDNRAAFVCHGLTFNRDFCKLKLSVWWSENGEVIDCEGFDALGRVRPVSEKVRRALSTQWGYVLAVYRHGLAKQALAPK